MKKELKDYELFWEAFEHYVKVRKLSKGTKRYLIARAAYNAGKTNYRNILYRIKKHSLPLEYLEDYDCGSINDYGGGDTQWWISYIRSEVAKTNAWWREQIEENKKVL